MCNVETKFYNDQISLFPKKELTSLTLPDTLSVIADISARTSKSLDSVKKKNLSQYYTPFAVAEQMAELNNYHKGRLGDLGAGTGILGAIVLSKALVDSPSSASLSLRAYEVDKDVHGSFNSTIEAVEKWAIQCGKTKPNVTLMGDIRDDADDILNGRLDNTLDSAIINPPYQKLGSQTELSKLMRAHGIPVPNLYAAFVVLTVLMLKPGGDVVAILPRSFCSGTYFKKFRQWLRTHCSLDEIIRYKSRSNVFRGDNVLQENVIIKLTKGVQQTACVRLSLCETAEHLPIHSMLLSKSDLFPIHTDSFLIPSDPDELKAIHNNNALPVSLYDMGLTVNTGKLEVQRCQEYIKTVATSHLDIPIVYAQHWCSDDKVLQWDSRKTSKPCYVELTDNTEKKLIPSGHYIFIKRISANDDRSGRCHPVIVKPSSIPGKQWAIDNHIQIISCYASDYPEDISSQLFERLSSEEVDHLLRATSGTTQLNVADISSVRFNH